MYTNNTYYDGSMLSIGLPGFYVNIGSDRIALRWSTFFSHGSPPIFLSLYEGFDNIRVIPTAS